MNSKTAESLKIKVEILASSIAAKIPFDIETAVWVAGIGDELAAKLSKVGLVAPRRIKGSLSELLSMYRDEREGQQARHTDQPPHDYQ